MRPQTPQTIKGAILNSAQYDRLNFIVDAISSVNPGRSKSANLAQAIGSFLMTVKKNGNKWVDLSYFRIGDDDGPVVVPSWISSDG